MKVNKPDPPSQVFLVRLWIEAQGDGPAAWRGKVQHLTSGEAYRFDDWMDLVALLQDMLPDPIDRSPPDDQP
jgi:hypothetical protein